MALGQIIDFAEIPFLAKEDLSGRFLWPPARTSPIRSLDASNSLRPWCPGWLYLCGATSTTLWCPQSDANARVSEGRSLIAAPLGDCQHD